MITKESFTKEWILKQRSVFPKADPKLIERQIYAFELLGLLVESGKEFVFKGGTSLLLLLPTAHRLSIDVDIVGNFTLQELTTLIQDSIFRRVEEDDREKSDIPKKHFKFFYTSVIDNRDIYVLLDILYTSHGYPQLQQIPIANALFSVEYELKTVVPTVDCILGDKLTAFAPKTIGVPFGKMKSMEIIKHLFDIGELFDCSKDLESVAESYRSIHKQERKYRESRPSLHDTMQDTLQDTLETSFLLCQSKLRGSQENEYVVELLQGIKQIQSYLLGEPYRIEEARSSAAKAALLIFIVKSNKINLNIEELRYDQNKIPQIQDVLLEGKYQILNKLKATQTDAFYYWWLIDKGLR